MDFRNYASAGSILSNAQSISSITDCFKANGQIDVTKYLQLLVTDGELYTVEDMNDVIHKRQATLKEKKKRLRRILLARRSPEGQLEAIPPTESLWWNVYIACPQIDDPRFLRKFRRRFRLPYTSYTMFVEEAKRLNWFPRWNNKDATGKNSSPLELLILGAFRYLGRGFTFDDLEECTAISEEVHRTFFHKFIDIGSTILYDRYVKAPNNCNE